MKRGMIIGLTVSAIFLLMGTMSFAQVDSSRPELNTIAMDNQDDELLLAHHVGNAPGWVGPDDTEDWNVHGGDWSYDDPDPNVDKPEEEPVNRPTEDPSQRNTKETGTAAKAGSDN